MKTLFSDCIDRRVYMAFSTLENYVFEKAFKVLTDCPCRFIISSVQGNSGRAIA